MDQDEYSSFSLLDGEEDEWTDVETRVSNRESVYVCCSQSSTPYSVLLVLRVVLATHQHSHTYQPGSNYNKVRAMSINLL